VIKQLSNYKHERRSPTLLIIYYWIKLNILNTAIDAAIDCVILLKDRSKLLYLVLQFRGCLPCVRD